MDGVMLSVEFMKYGYVFIPILIVTYLLTIFFDGQLVKAILHVMKAAAYGGLAFLMWKYYQDRTQIDMISVFTFIFCCFECTDNLFSLISIPVEKLRNTHEVYKNKMDMLDMMQRLGK